MRMTAKINVAWNVPSESCNCDIDYYQIDILSQSSDTMVDSGCNIQLQTVNTSKNNIFVESNCEQCFFQVSALYADGVAVPGPCHFVNVSDFTSITCKISITIVLA